MSNDGWDMGDPPQSYPGMFDQLMDEQPTQPYSRSQPETRSSDINCQAVLNYLLANGLVHPDAVRDGFLWAATDFGYLAGYENGSQLGKFSGTTTTGSLTGIMTPGSVTGYGSGSHISPYLDPAYSEASNQTSSESFEGQQFYDPSDVGYHDSQPYAGQISQHGGSDKTLIPFQDERELILADQSHPSNELQYCPDAYRPGMPGTEDELIDQNLNNCSTPQGPSAYLALAFTNNVDTQNRLVGPFNPPIQRCASEFPSGLVARASLHGTAAAQVSEEVSNAPPMSSSSQSLSVRSGSYRHTTQGPRKTPIGKGKDKQKHEGSRRANMIIFDGSMEQITANNEALSHRRGGRQGKLDPDVAEKARHMRKLKACWNCWLRKETCSDGIPCNGCEKRNSPFAGLQCFRSHFEDFVKIFFPDVLYAHLQELATKSFISENVAEFVGDEFSVDVSVGGEFEPMKLQVKLFLAEATQLKLLRHARLVKDDNNKLQLFEAYSAPIGIKDPDQNVLKRACNAYINAMVENPKYISQTTAGDTSSLPRLLLKKIIKYFKTNKSKLSEDVLKMHAIHYFMKSVVTLTPSSIKKICEKNLVLNQADPSSRLINRQLKQTMRQIHYDTTLAVLQGIEHSLRLRHKKSWAPSFCAILVLCLCIGSLQIAADTMIVYEMRTKGEQAQWTQAVSFDLCGNLDEFPFGKCVQYFHEVYHTNRKPQGGRKGDAFNPLKAASMKEPPGLGDKAGDELVISIHDLISSSEEEIMNLATRGPLVRLDEYVDAQIIEENGNGRLAAKFLMSFFE